METLERLQNWYFAQCNGDWEHEYGIFIENADNPGWIVTIDITETNLEDKNFEEINVEQTEKNWFFCRVEDKKFKGFGGPFNLSEILEVFLAWTENSKDNT